MSCVASCESCDGHASHRSVCLFASLCLSDCPSVSVRVCLVFFCGCVSLSVSVRISVSVCLCLCACLLQSWPLYLSNSVDHKLFSTGQFHTHASPLCCRWREKEEGFPIIPKLASWKGGRKVTPLWPVPAAGTCPRFHLLVPGFSGCP